MWKRTSIRPKPSVPARKYSPPPEWMMPLALDDAFGDLEDHAVTERAGADVHRWLDLSAVGGLVDEIRCFSLGSHSAGLYASPTGATRAR
jgi:hypothetical protein